MDTQAEKDFWKEINPKINVKSSTTFSKRKLPMVYEMTMQAVTAKVTKDLQYTTGVGFTCDHWTSKNLDPYFGMTLHYIGRNWEMER